MIKTPIIANAKDGLYTTENYARIICNSCGNKNVDELKPGQPFDSIKKCACQEIKPAPRRKPAAKAVVVEETLELKAE